MRARLRALPMCRRVVATTDCLLYKWDLDAVEKMASPACAALAAAWRNFVLYCVGAAFSGTCGDVSTPPCEPYVLKHILWAVRCQYAAPIDQMCTARNHSILVDPDSRPTSGLPSPFPGGVFQSRMLTEWCCTRFTHPVGSRRCLASLRVPGQEI